MNTLRHERAVCLPHLASILALCCLSAGCHSIEYETWGAPLKGAGQIVVLFHGEGSLPSDMKSLAGELRDLGLPANTCYVLPVGPYSSEKGKAWFLQGEDINQMRPRIIRFVDSAISKAGLQPDKVFIGGFSQGAVIAIDIALHYNSRLGGIAALSSSQNPAGGWKALAPPPKGMATPFLIAHGNSDNVVSLEIAEAIRSMLEIKGYAIEFLRFEGGHAITKDVTRAVVEFIKANGH